MHYYFNKIQFFKLHLLAAIFCFSTIGFAQKTFEDDIYSSSKPSTSKVNGWQEGYIIKREHSDTLWGLVKKNKAMGFIEWVDFKPSDKEKKKPFRADSIIGFKYGHIVYNYFDCCGWSELIAHGTIDMYRGLIVKPKCMTIGSVESFIFKKKGGDEKIIERDDAIKQLSGGILRNDIKGGFYYYFGDNPELMAELENENFKYRNLINLVERYNEWAKNHPRKK